MLCNNYYLGGLGRQGKNSEGMRKDLKHVEVKGRAEWRRWLEQHHEQTESIWLVIYKKKVPQWCLPYAEVVEEALCFGWVDSLPGKVDEERSKILLSPRRKGSVWSALNKRRVADLTARGLMHPAGLAKVERAKQDGTWTVLDAVEAMEMPEDLRVALEGNTAAREKWEKLAPSKKKGLLQLLQSAKRPETRSKRLADLVEKL
jgi:uncharacterized protein YdeI (YjbR/CyaY-like superfamily)